MQRALAAERDAEVEARLDALARQSADAARPDSTAESGRSDHVDSPPVGGDRSPWFSEEEWSGDSVGPFLGDAFLTQQEFVVAEVTRLGQESLARSGIVAGQGTLTSTATWLALLAAGLPDAMRDVASAWKMPLAPPLTAENFRDVPSGPPDGGRGGGRPGSCESCATWSRGTSSAGSMSCPRSRERPAVRAGACR